MLIHPDFDPVAFSVGVFSVRWYGLMYLMAYLSAAGLMRLRPCPGWGKEAMDSLMFWIFMGLIVGGRLGEVLFYMPGYYLSAPLEIFAVWKGGMSFHGGFLGAVFTAALWAKKHGYRWLAVTDLIAPLIPLGLMFGRIGNFINGEIWGRVADPALPWAMVFPRAGFSPRHPVQLYHASLEGLALFIILWVYSGKKRPEGAVSGAFLLGYGVFRSLTECFREPDPGIFGFSYTFTMGQWLSLPMIIFGLFLLYRARKNPAQSETNAPKP